MNIFKHFRNDDTNKKKIYTNIVSEESEKNNEDGKDGGDDKDNEGNTSIFTQYQCGVNIDKILSSIPENSETCQNIKKYNDGYTEWRWRFLNIDSKIKVEISKANIKSKLNRVYIDIYGNERNIKISNDYDKYVIKEFFYYAKCNQ